MSPRSQQSECRGHFMNETTKPKSVGGSIQGDRVNIATDTVAGFGDEWTRFDQTSIGDAEIRALFEAYFWIFPWQTLPANPTGFDLGCGSGRWAKQVAPRVGHLHCIDASAEALAVARRNLDNEKNCDFHHASVDAIPLPDGSMDFGFSLGVLHHVPDTLAGIRSCVAKLKPGAPFLLYLYYAFDNRPFWFRCLWRASDSLRKVVSRLPHGLRYLVSQVFALTVYYPLARSALILEKCGITIRNFPLFYYRNLSFYVMRTDALDRFGTRLEQRFTQEQMRAMMMQAGLEDIVFSDKAPYWCAVGVKSQ